MPRVLHVDDHDGSIFVVKDAFQSLGGDWEVISCKDLPDAKDEYARGNFVLVICDFHVNCQGDGMEWAGVLANAGQKVATYATGSKGIPGIPHVDKCDAKPSKLLALLDG